MGVTGAPDARRLNVLIEVNSADLRIGAVNDALDLAELSAPAAVAFTICGVMTDDLRDEAARRGARTVAMSSRTFSRSGLPLYALDVMRWIGRLVRWRPDVVHLNFPGYGRSLAYAARLCRIPIVERAGPFVPGNPSNGWVSAYVANGHAHAAALLDSPLADRVVITGDLFRPDRVRATMAPERALPAKADHAVRVVFLGQVVERKGLHVLVEAFARTASSCELMLVGGDWSAPGYAARVKALAREAGVADRIHFENHRQDVGAVLQTADIFVLPSLSEARPRSIIEAMSLGIPIVASEVGGIPSLVVHEETGLLVPADDAGRLADALDRLARSPSLRSQFGEAGRRRAQDECRPDRTAFAYAALYRRLVASRPSRRGGNAAAFGAWS
jgi:glycosyltransferase involved in cell wall biosynthesis